MKLLKKLALLATTTILLATAVNAQYMGMTYQDILTVKAGSNFNTTSYTASGADVSGSGFGLSASLAYDYKMGPFLLSFGVGVINEMPKLSSTVLGISSDAAVRTTNSFTADGIFKIAASTGAYIGAGMSAYMPFETAYPKSTFDLYANAEIGINLQAGDYAFFTPAVRVGYNLTNNRIGSVASSSSPFDLNIQFLIGVGFRIFNTTGSF